MQMFVVPPVGFRDARIPAFISKESSLRRFLGEPPRVRRRSRRQVS